MGLFFSSRGQKLCLVGVGLGFLMRLALFGAAPAARITFVLLVSSPGTAGRRPVEDLQAFRCFALHQGPAGLHALGQDTGQRFDFPAGSRGNGGAWPGAAVQFLPPTSRDTLFLFKVKVGAVCSSSRILFTKAEHPQRRWLTVTN